MVLLKIFLRFLGSSRRVEGLTKQGYKYPKKDPNWGYDFLSL